MLALWLVYLIGAGAIAIIGGAAFCLAVNCFLDWRRAPHQRSFDEGYAHAMRHLAGKAHWFTEDPATRDLIEELAKDLHVGDTRDRWRERRNQAARADSAA